MSESISVVVPCYRCGLYLEELSQRLESTLSKITDRFEIVLVDDGSPENDWEVIQRLSLRNPHVVGVELSRNFGQHCAITAGLRSATGDWVVVMDGDLQDCPEDIPALYEKARQGYDSVMAKRWERGDSEVRRWMSRGFYSVLAYLTDTAQDADIANFGIYHRKVIAAICQMPERLRYFPVMVRWVGFRTTTVLVTRQARVGSPSSYSLAKMLLMALDIMIAFSDKPLRLVAKFGFVLSLMSAGTGFYYLYLYLIGKVLVLGWTSLMLTTTFLGGLTIFVLGVVGIYVGKVLDETKKRPIYLVRQELREGRSV